MVQAVTAIYPPITVYPPTSNGYIHIPGHGTRPVSTVGSQVATEDQVRRAALDWPRFCPAEAFHRIKGIHIFANIILDNQGYAVAALYSRAHLFIGGSPFTARDPEHWEREVHALVGHELGHAWEQRWLTGEYATRYYALRNMSYLGTPPDENAAEDIRVLLGGPLVSARHHTAYPLMGDEIRGKVLAVLLDAARQIPEPAAVMPAPAPTPGSEPEAPPTAPVPPVKSRKLVRPFDGDFAVTAEFGRHNPALWGPEGHRGVDYACPVGTPVRAVAAGMVVEIVASDRLGKHITLEHRHDDPALVVASRYAHLDATVRDLVVGDWLDQGQTFAYSGRTGNRGDGQPMPAHLHLEVLDATGAPINPEPLMVEPVYPDVMPERWSAEAIEWCKAAGLMIGRGDGTFGPTTAVTREQLAVVLVRLQGGDTHV